MVFKNWKKDLVHFATCIISAELMVGMMLFIVIVFLIEAMSYG